MTKDCGCHKKPKGKKNNIWDYIKGYEPKPIDNNLPSYQGRNGFKYQTNNGTYVIFFNFSIVNNDIIKYFITLSKVEEVKYDKKTNTITNFLKCKKQFSHDFSVNPEIINVIIDNISNKNYDSIPHNSHLFNGVIINIIKQGEKKEGLITKLVSVEQQDKDLSTQGCTGNCNSVTCGDTCGTCTKKTLFAKSYCRR